MRTAIEAATNSSCSDRKEEKIGASGAPASREVADLQDRRDRESLEQIARGAEDGFSELFRRYAPIAAGVAFRVIGDQALAEEVVQEVFVSVWRSAGAYDAARGSVRSWMLAQVHHRAVDAVRREEAQRRRAAHEAIPLIDDPLDDVIEEGWMRSRQVQVRAALTSLPQEQRQVLELAYYRGMTQTQVSQAMDIPLGTVKSRTLAAMTKLRAVLVGSGAL